jgi:hypothetical protein
MMGSCSICAPIAVESIEGDGQSLELVDDPAWSWAARDFPGFLISKHDELETPRQWINPLARLVSNGEFYRDGLMPDGPSA